MIIIRYYSTEDFPHPMAGLDYSNKSSVNASSYDAYELIQWSSFGPTINRMRQSDLKVSNISSFTSFVKRSKIPFSAMWSPSFVPKPADWPEQCQVVGTFTASKKNDTVFDTTPFSSLVKWLDEGNPPIFVGFGSMVVSNPQKLEQIIITAARNANCRVVVQSGWSKLDVSSEPLCHNVGPCPHDWLLPLCAAVVHHGGAGTTAAGIRHAKPTLVCPFFADQFMWAEMVFRAGVGPKPCPVGNLTADILAEKFKLLLSEEVKAKVVTVADKMNREDGISTGLEHFLSSLPVDNMLCDVTLLMGDKPQIARYKLGRHDIEQDIKISAQVAAFVQQETSEVSKVLSVLNRITNSVRTTEIAHNVTSYNLGVPRTFLTGTRDGICGFIGGLLYTIYQIFQVPDQGARSYGAFGCLLGVVFAPIRMFLLAIRSLLVLLDRPLTGLANSSTDTNVSFVLDFPRSKQKFISPVVKAQRIAAAASMSKARKKEISQILEIVVKARYLFNKSSPVWHGGQRHFRVVDPGALITVIQTNNNNTKAVNFTENELARIISFLRGEKENISFSRFLRMLHVVLKAKIQAISWRRAFVRESTFKGLVGAEYTS